MIKQTYPEGHEKAGQPVMADATAIKWNNVFATDTSLALAWQEEQFGHAGTGVWPTPVGNNATRTAAGSAYDLTPTHIKGSLTAMTALTNWVVSNTRKAIGREMISNSQDTMGAWKGGRGYQDFIAGSIAHFSRFAMNMAAMIPGAAGSTVGLGGRWANLGTALLLSGNINAIPDYVGYGINEAMGGATQAALGALGGGKYGGTKYTAADGLVRVRDSGYAGVLSPGKPGAVGSFTRDRRASANNSPSLSTAALGIDADYSGEPGGTQTTGFGSAQSTPEASQEHIAAALEQEESSPEEKAAVQQQQEEVVPSSHGAMMGFDADDDVDDDGGE